MLASISKKLMLMNNSLRFAALAGFIGAVSIPGISSAAAAEQNTSEVSNRQEDQRKVRDQYRMSWDVSQGVGIDVENADDPLLSSRFAVKGIPLTSGRVPVLGRPSLDVYGTIESPAGSFVSDTRESLLARINLLTLDIELNRPSAHKEDFFDSIKFSPEFRILRTRQSSPQLYGGGSISQGIFSADYNLDANTWFGFQAGPDYLVSGGGDFLLEVSNHLSLGANLEMIFPGAKDKFAGYFSLGPKFLLNSSNQGVMLHPYFMLNGFSVSKADVRNRDVPPMQAGLNVGYYGYEIFKGKR